METTYRETDRKTKEQKKHILETYNRFLIAHSVIRSIYLSLGLSKDKPKVHKVT